LPSLWREGKEPATVAELTVGQELKRIIDRLVFTSCWELATSRTGAPEEETDLQHEIETEPCPITIREIQAQLDELEDCGTDLTEEQLDEVEDRAWDLERELQGVEPREVIQYWLVHGDLANHYAWAEMDIVPPVFQKFGLNIWACKFNSLTDDWYLEQLVEHICARRRALLSS